MLVLAGAYLLCFRLGMMAQESVPLWPAAGVSLAGLYILGESRWPGLFIAALVSPRLLGVHLEPRVALAFALGHTLETLAGVWLLRRLRFVPTLVRIRDVLALTVTAVPCSLLTLGVVGGAMRMGGSDALGAATQISACDVWLASIVGVWVVSPVLLMLSERRAEPRWREALVLAVLVVGTCLWSFALGEQDSELRYARVFLLFPLSAWCSLRFGPRGIALMTLVLAAVACVGSFQGRGPFYEELAAASSAGGLQGHGPLHLAGHVRLLELQFFLAVTAFSGMLLSAAHAEHADTQAQLKLLATAVRSAREGVVICEVPEGQGPRASRVVFANASFLEMGGWRLEELLGRPPRALAAWEPHWESHEPLIAAVSEGRALRTDVVLSHREGSGVVTEMQLSPVRGARGRVTHWVATYRDITQQRRLQAKLLDAERVAAMGMLAAGVGHEINNPLAYLMLNVEGLARSLKKGPEELMMEARARLEYVRESAERIRVIARDLKGFSRQQGEERAMVDLNEVVVSALRMAAHSVRARARLVQQLGEAPQVPGDETRLGQVVLNLLVNALQSIPEGAPERHEVRVRTGRDDAGRALVEVADTGCGMTPDVMGHIFEPFFTTKSSQEGTGLGLSICQQVAQAHGGELLVRSEPGRGSVFTLLLPAAATAGQPSAAVPSSEELLPVFQVPARRRILVIDDEPRLAQSMRMLIEPTHEVVVTTRGAEALAWVSAGQRFDLVLCDLQMPETSGMDVYQHLRAHVPEMAERLVFISGGAYTQVMRDFVRSVDNRILDKPVRPDDLLATIDEALATQSAA